MSSHSTSSLPWRPALLPLLALVGVLALAALGWAAAPAPWPAAAVEVVEGRPLRVEHGGTLSPRPLRQAGAPASPAPEGGEFAPGGRAAVPQSSYDFGTLRAGEVVQHDFLLLNQGSTPLTLRGAYTTCGCTTALISAQVIPPGKAARATLIFDAGYHDVRGQTVRRGLVIETSDPDRSQVELWVQAAVR